MATLENLVEIVQRLTHSFSPPRQGRRFRPMSVQITYFALLVLKRRGVALPDDLARQEFSGEAVAAFRDEALHVAGMFATEYPRIEKLLRELKGPGLMAAQQRLYEWMLKTSFFQAPALPRHVQLAGVRRKAQEQWQQRWEALLREVWQDVRFQVHFNVLNDLLLPPAVFPRVQEKRALEALRERLTLDRAQGWAPSEQMFLFGEPFERWLVRPFLTGQTLLRICQALADQAGALVEMIHQMLLQAAREAGVHEQAATDLERYQRLSSARRRAVPMPPTGTVSAATIFDLAVMGWRQSHPAARAATVAADQHRLEPESFQELVKRALEVTVNVLWDEAAGFRALKTSSPAFWEALRQSALPESLWGRYQVLLGLFRRHLPQPATSPQLEAWEAALRSYARRITARLDASPSPGVPLTTRVLQSRAYLYDRPFWEWCREALPSRMPDFGVVYEYCLALAHAQGAWPGEAALGAPHSAEEAGRMIAYYTKLTIEGLLSRSALARLGARLERSPFCVPMLPQRADGGLTLWIGQPVPPAALELARVVAPLIAHFLYIQACDPLGFLPYDLQNEAHASWQTIRPMLLARARGLGYPQDEAEAAVEEVVVLVSRRLSRLLLPQSITLALLEGDEAILAQYGLWVDNKKYIIYTDNYRFIGVLQSYIRRCLRPAAHGASVLSYDERVAGGEEQAWSLFGSDEPGVEEMVLQREADAPLVTRAEERHAAVLERAEREVVRLMLTTDLNASFPLPQDQRDRLFSRQRRVLAHGLAACAGGEQFLRQRLRRQDSLALAVQGLAAQGLSDDEALFTSDRILPRTLDRGGPPEMMVLLAQLLAHPSVREESARREAVARLFGLPLSLESPDQPEVCCAARLERVGAGALIPELGDVSVRALEALGDLAPRERKAVVLRLLRLADVRLTLALLRRAGWAAPPWFTAAAESPEALAAHEASEVIHSYQAVGEQYDLPDSPVERGQMQPWLIEQLLERASPQIFQEGRARWHGALAKSVDPRDQAAAGKVAEWLGIGPWDEPWLRPRTAEQARAAGYVFKTLVAALPATLRWCFQQARALTTEAEHALGWPELLGLAGCLPPLLPLPLEDPVFLQRLAWRLFEVVLARLAPAEARRTHFPTKLPDEVRASLVEGRARIAALFQALGRLPDEQERRVVLAALSAAEGQPGRFAAWLAGGVIDQQASAAMSAIVHLAHHSIVLDAAQVPAVFAQARQKGELLEAWRGVWDRKAR
jgi:hypothetical protein